MSMITAFISTNLVCAMLISIIASGVPTEGLTSRGLIIAAFTILLGDWAGPAITFLSFSFGIGVMVPSFFGAIASVGVNMEIDGHVSGDTYYS